MTSGCGLGFTRLVGRGGSTATLVGTVAQVVGEYLKYYDLGAHAFYLRGWDIAADASAYGPRSDSQPSCRRRGSKKRRRARPEPAYPKQFLQVRML